MTVFLIKIPVEFFMEAEKLMVIFMRRPKRAKNSQDHFEE